MIGFTINLNFFSISKKEIHHNFIRVPIFKKTGTIVTNIKHFLKMMMIYQSEYVANLDLIYIPCFDSMIWWFLITYSKHPSGSIHSFRDLGYSTKIELRAIHPKSFGIVINLIREEENPIKHHFVLNCYQIER